jgi:hypothetical protein
MSPVSFSCCFPSRNRESEKTLVNIDSMGPIDSYYGKESASTNIDSRMRSTNQVKIHGSTEIQEIDIKLDLDLPLNQHFKFIATIGKGAYGSVYLVENNLCPD